MVFDCVRLSVECLKALEEKSQPASQACLLAHAFATVPTTPAICVPLDRKKGGTRMFATASGMGHVRHPSGAVSNVRFSRETQATSTLETTMISFEQKTKTHESETMKLGQNHRRRTSHLRTHGVLLPISIAPILGNTFHLCNVSPLTLFVRPPPEAHGHKTAALLCPSSRSSFLPDPRKKSGNAFGVACMVGREWGGGGGGIAEGCNDWR